MRGFDVDRCLARPSRPDLPRVLSIVIAAVLGAALLWLTNAGAAAAVPATKAVHYRGYTITVPASWPVFRLAPGSSTCVRFNRHAVYLGAPSAHQLCPAHAAGHTEAILVAPAGARSGAAVATGGSAGQLLDRARHVVVTATWSRHAALIRGALRLASLSQLSAPPVGSPAASVKADAARARASSVAQPGEVYTGLGFDACSTPSTSQMSAWAASPYRAIGVYIGGTNAACAETNLTAAWVSEETAAGWHLFPIYVGLQAPSNSCGCASIAPATAAAQGTAAAQDAVLHAQAIGLGTGNPIYDDMEGYARTTTNTSAVLAFLAAWTAQLHASGYLSGVYSSADSGIVDLAAQYGTGYTEPDDLWIARWNGAQNTSDPNVPATEWSTHQRLHQYSGDQNQRYGGVTISLDADYVDGATAVAGGVTTAVDSAPTLTVTPAADGSIALFPNWTGGTGVSAWQILGGAAPTSLGVAVAASASQKIIVHNAFPYFQVSALGPGGQTLATSLPVSTPPHLAIFGASAFVPARGLGGVPVGCFNATDCHVTTTITAGRTMLASTGSEHVPRGGGVAFFSLSRLGHAMVSGARGHRLLVTVTVRDVSGLRVSRQLKLVPFTTSGRPPLRSLRQAATLKLIGSSDFVSRGGAGTGGILAACLASAPCHPRTTITSGRTTIARTGLEALGVGELGYLFFSMTPAGRQLLTHAPGHQIGAKVTVSNGGVSATGHIVLAAFS